MLDYHWFVYRSCNQPVGCLAGPVHIHPGIQGGPGQIGVLNSDWPRIWDAVGARRSGDAPGWCRNLTVKLDTTQLCLILELHLKPTDKCYNIDTKIR